MCRYCEAWIGTLATMRRRLELGSIDTTERRLSLAAIAVIEVDLDRAWRSLQNAPRGLFGHGEDVIPRVVSARDEILDQLVRLRVALTANLGQSIRRAE